MLHCRLKTVSLSKSVWDLTIKQTFFDENVPDIVYCAFTGGYFRPCGSLIGVRVCLREVKIGVLKREIAGTAVCCPTCRQV